MYSTPQLRGDAAGGTRGDSLSPCPLTVAGSGLTALAGEGVGNCRAESPVVDLWIAPASLDDALAEYSWLLDPTQRAELEAVRHSQQRRRSLASKVLLRLVLSSHTDGAVSPDQWRFSVDNKGKPLILNEQVPLNFSLSHNEAGTVIALSGTAPVGVDIETLDQSTSDDMFAFFLSARERACLQDLSSDERQQAFLKLWTLKEAYTKLLGVGLNADFSSLAFSLDPPRLLNAPALPVQFGTWCSILDHKPCHISLAYALHQALPLASNLRLLSVSDGSVLQSLPWSHPSKSTLLYRVGQNHDNCDDRERTAKG